MKVLFLLVLVVGMVSGGWAQEIPASTLNLPPRERITAANADSLSLYMVQAKRAERVLWSPGGSVLAVLDGVDLDLYRVSDWLAAPVRFRFDQTPSDIAFSPDGRLLYVAVPGGVVGFDTMTGAQTERYPIDARRIAPSPEGTRLAWVARSGSLEVFNRADRTSFNLAPTAEDVIFSADGRWVVAALTDKSALAFDLVTRQPGAAFASDSTAAAPEAPLHGVGMTGDGRTLLLPAGSGAGFAVFPFAQPGAEPINLMLPTGYNRVYGWGIQARSGLLAGAGIAGAPADSAVLVWSLNGAQPLAVLKHPGVRDAAISPDGTLLASVGGGALRLWAVGESLLTPEQARSLSAVNVVAACDVYGSRPRLGEIIGGQTVSLVWSWYAATPQQVRDYLDTALFQLTLDGQVVRPWVFVTQTLPDSVNDGNPTVYLYAPVGSLSSGSHTSAVEVTWVRPINDGFGDYGPGTSSLSDGGACSFSAS
ncbi:MAG: WD40 repeat domain-containing protein [Anaerolineae bacterium]|nr:WD40 repeat domain-containing protein [Anaerolineae bacterium]